jgi:hypothetical protein
MLYLQTDESSRNLIANQMILHTQIYSLGYGLHFILTDRINLLLLQDRKLINTIAGSCAFIRENLKRRTSALRQIYDGAPDLTKTYSATSKVSSSLFPIRK